MEPLDTYYLIVATAFLIIATCIRLAVRLSSIRHSLLKNFLIAIIPSAVFLFLCELSLHFVLVRSDGFGFTRSAQRWWDIYWQPVNSFGYRDYDLTPESIQNRHLLMLVGDSIVAGHGIDYVEDRFGNKLEKLLGERWRVGNIAKCGWNTRDEVAALRIHLQTLRPNIIVVSYFYNDIEGAAYSVGLKAPSLLSNAPWANSFFVKNSALLNYAYWSVFRTINKDIGPQYWETLNKYRENVQVRAVHQNELTELVNLAAQSNAKLYVLMIPFLTQIGADRAFVTPVETFFEAQNIPVVTLEAELGAIPLDVRVVNSFDGHPGPKAQTIIANKLFEAVRPELEF